MSHCGNISQSLLMLPLGAFFMSWRRCIVYSDVCFCVMCRHPNLAIKGVGESASYPRCFAVASPRQF